MVNSYCISSSFKCQPRTKMCAKYLTVNKFSFLFVNYYNNIKSYKGVFPPV